LQKEIIAALDKVCSVLPDTIKETCDQLIDQYGEMIISLLLAELDPQEVCTLFFYV
jgi:saposin